VTYFTADLHFNHTNIIKYCNRFGMIENFEQYNNDTQQLRKIQLTQEQTQYHDDTIINNINSKIQKNDELWILGDFFFGSETLAIDYRNRINCKNVHLILGNHDKSILRIARDIFASVSDMQTVVIYSRRFFLCHYAMRTWPGNYYDEMFENNYSIHLYGHSHGTLADEKTHLSMDVGIDTNNYFPYSVKDVLQIMENKKRIIIESKAA
jgi:calcineurin-like phosphoesterase family protein